MTVGVTVTSGNTHFVGDGTTEPDDLVLGDGTLIVGSGGLIISATVSRGGVDNISSGGSVVNTILAGNENVLAGGSAITTDVLSGDILYSSATTISWSQSVRSGTLTVTYGSETANLTLIGNYSAGDFHAESDGYGGTTIYDPSPTAAASGTTLVTHTG